MIRYREVVQTQRGLVHDEIVCDRCGERMIILAGGGRMRGHDFPCKGGLLIGRIFPDNNLANTRHVSAELCPRCLSEILETIPNARVETESDAAKLNIVRDEGGPYNDASCPPDTMAGD